MADSVATQGIIEGDEGGRQVRQLGPEDFAGGGSRLPLTGAPLSLGFRLDGLAEVVSQAELWRLGGAELGALLTSAERLVRRLEGLQAGIVGEAIARGETGATTGPGCRPAAVAWTSHRLSPAGDAPAEPSRVKALVDLARDLSLGDSAARSTSTDGREVLAGAVRSGQVSVAKARVCVAEMARLESLLLPGAVPAVWAGYTDLARTAAARQLHGLRPFMLTRYGLDERLELDADQAARFVALSAARVDGALFHYRLTLDAEQHAVLEAAVGALSAPCPGTDGTPDQRTAEQRRGEALAAIVGRAVRAGNGTPVQARSQLLLTASVRDRVTGQGMVGPGRVVGSLAAGTVLPPSTLRRHACSDGAFGLLFGVTGADLALGRRTRFFTSRQRTAMVVRDGHCTYPGCRTPATWCDGHHLVHWLDGGPTDLTNAALLCGRHHTLVHRRRLAGRLDPTSGGEVVWDLDPGSYDRLLAEGAEGAAHEPDRP